MKRLILLVLTMVGMLVFVAGCTEDKVVKVVGDVPAVPTGVSSTTGDQQVKVYWPSNNDRGVTEGYGVYRFTGTADGVDRYELLGTVIASSGYLDGDMRWYSYVDYNVTNGVTYYYSVNAYNKWGESELSKIDATDTPRPQGAADFALQSVSAQKLGFDFSNHRIVSWDSDNADMFVEFDTSLQQYFIDVSNGSTLLQDYGYVDSLAVIGWGNPGGGWSELGWAELLVGHGYLVYTSDEHYAAIWISSIDYTHEIVYADWAYQTDPNNPELKRGLITRPQHDANYGKRKG